MAIKNSENRTYVSFDWAIKRLLRKKANYSVLEGFLSVLLKREVVVQDLLESESNRESTNSKMIVVDVLCKIDNGDLVIIEVQFFHQADYFQRILYGVSKVLSEHLKSGEKYARVKKVISVSLVYFDLGHGADYLYHGQTQFIGMNKSDTLRLSAYQEKAFSKETPEEIFPEYYLIKINNFDNVSRSPLEDWVYYFKNSELPPKCDEKVLTLLSQQLKYDAMDTKEKQDYQKYSKSKVIWDSTIDTAYNKGYFEGEQLGVQRGIEQGIEKGIEQGLEKGIEQGIEKGLEKAKIETVISAYKSQLALSIIAQIVHLPESEIRFILKEEGLM